MLNQVVPDSVFSEMRFLQKPESSTKEEPNTKPVKKLQKKKRRQSSEKEISRYFDVGAMRPGEDDTVQRRQTPPVDTVGVARGVQTTSPVVSDLLEKPFLGFGGRGSHPPTTSFYSWSESGQGSSARMAHFVQDLEPLAVGQLQSGRALQQIEGILFEQDTAQCSPAEQVIPGQHSKNGDTKLEPAQKISQTNHPSVKPSTNRGFDSETMPVSISKKQETPVPAAISLVNQSERERHSANRTLTADEPMPNMPKDDAHCGTKPAQAGLSTNPVLEQYLEPWEELLQTCELAARPPMPTYYDEDLPRCDSPVCKCQRSTNTYNHANLPLWKADVEHFTEYDYPDNTAFMSEHVHWTQPEANIYQEDLDPFLGEMMEEVSESLDSEDDYELATEDAVEWDIANAERYDEVQDYQTRNGEAVDDFAMFWQPNKLY